MCSNGVTWAWMAKWPLFARLQVFCRKKTFCRQTLGRHTYSTLYKQSPRHSTKWHLGTLTWHCVGQLSFGQISVGQLSVGQMSVGQMVFDLKPQNSSHNEQPYQILSSSKMDFKIAPRTFFSTKRVDGEIKWRTYHKCFNLRSHTVLKKDCSGFIHNNLFCNLRMSQMCLRACSWQASPA